MAKRREIEVVIGEDGLSDALRTFKPGQRIRLTVVGEDREPSSKLTGLELAGSMKSKHSATLGDMKRAIIRGATGKW